MSENTEGTIKNGQSRETGNIDEEIVAGLNPVNGIPTLSILIIGSAIQYSYGREKNNEYPVHIRGGSRGGASENTEGTIKNGQSRETGNIDEEKQSKNTTQYALDTTMHKQSQIT
jgi:hypothetical protein